MQSALYQYMHSNAFHQAPHFFDLDYEPELVAVCGRDKANAEAHAARWGFASVETDWQKLIDRDDIDMVDIAAPNDMHKDIVSTSMTGWCANTR